jgi:hypothetical protein
LHAGDTTAGRNKSPDFSTLSGFLVETGRRAGDDGAAEEGEEIAESRL